MQLVDFFRQQFASLPAAFEVYPAVGPDMCIQLAQQGLQMGGTSFVDFVLLAPDFLHNKSPAGLVGRLKMMGMRVCAYGWQPQGPLRDLVEGSNLDGFIAGEALQDSSLLLSVGASLPCGAFGQAFARDVCWCVLLNRAG